MTQIMTATEMEMTDGQIENAVGKLRDAMRKHRSGITSDVAQQVLGVENLGMVMFTPFRERAEVLSNLIVRRVKVNRLLTPQQVLDATGRKQYTNRKVVNAMPRGEGGGEGDETEVVFFKPEPWEYTRPDFMSDDDFEKALGRRNLKSAPPDDVAAVNEADPAFADTRPNGTHWKDADGKWCFAAFDRWNGEREVGVDRDGYVWHDLWWFAGLRLPDGKAGKSSGLRT